MNNTASISKKTYLQPQIMCIELDNEISLALQSSPPIGPSETYNQPEDSSSNPFRNTIA